MTTQIDARTGLGGDAAIKVPARVATTADITLSAVQTVDGIALVADDRVLVKDQTAAEQNGVYIVSATDWFRAADFNGIRDVVAETFLRIQEGTANSRTEWALTTMGTISFGITELTFALTSLAVNTPIVDAGGYYTSDDVEGALQEVGADIAGLAAAAVDTIAALKAIDATTVADGTLYHIKGHTTVGDKGAGLFLWDAASTDTDDNGYIIQPTAGGTGRWLRQTLNNVVTMEQWGGLASATTNTAALNSVIVHSQLNSATTLELLGVYKFTTKPNALAGALRIQGNSIVQCSLVRNYTPALATGSTTDAAGYSISDSVITLASAGTGAIATGAYVKFAGLINWYKVTSGDADVSGGGSITISPPLYEAIPAGATAITVTEPFLQVKNSYSTLSDFDLSPGDGTSGGSLLMLDASDAAPGPTIFANWNFFNNLRFVGDISGSANGTCYQEILLNGRDVDSGGALGLRDVAFTNCWAGFTSTINSLDSVSARQLLWHGGYLQQNVSIKGDATVVSSNVSLTPVSGGTLDAEQVNGLIITGVWTAGTIGANVIGSGLLSAVTAFTNSSQTFSLVDDNVAKSAKFYGIGSSGNPSTPDSGSVFHAYTGNGAVTGYYVQRGTGLLGSRFRHDTDGSGEFAAFDVENSATAVTGLKVYADKVEAPFDMAVGGAATITDSVTVGGHVAVKADGGAVVLTRTNTQLLAVGDAINTTDKAAGKLVYSSSAIDVFVASGAAASNGWKGLVSGTILSPV